MTEKTKEKTADEMKNELIEKLGEKEKIQQVKNIEEATVLIATRTKLERDYDEDKIEVIFSTSPETKRKVLAKRPNNKEMVNIMTLSAQASRAEGSMNADNLESMVGIYQRLAKMAANLSCDKKLDEQFWDENVSFTTLQNFITELIEASQKGYSIPQETMKKFR